MVLPALEALSVREEEAACLSSPNQASLSAGCPEHPLESTQAPSRGRDRLRGAVVPGGAYTHTSWGVSQRGSSKKVAPVTVPCQHGCGFIQVLVWEGFKPLPIPVPLSLVDQTRGNTPQAASD